MCVFSKDPPVEKCYQVLMDLANMNLSILNGKDPSDLDQSIRTTMKGECVSYAGDQFSSF